MISRSAPSFIALLELLLPPPTFDTTGTGFGTLLSSIFCVACLCARAHTRSSRFAVIASSIHELVLEHDSAFVCPFAKLSDARLPHTSLPSDAW